MFTTVGPETPAAEQALEFPESVESPLKVSVSAIMMKQEELEFP
jgi:hypothetical protein